jgi:hypothetical protein
MLKPGPKALCVDCHEKFGTPKCIPTATFFYTTITGLAGQAATLEKDVDRLSERGFDVDDLRFQASAVGDALRKVRLDIHTFDRSDFLKGSEAASTALDGLKKATARTWLEYRYRRTGLLFATAFISLFGVLLYLKIRQADRK